MDRYSDKDDLSSNAARALHDEELREDAQLIRPDEPHDDAFEGYDEEQRAEVLEAEGTDPFNRAVMNNLAPDEGEDDGFPDEDSEIDDQM